MGNFNGILRNICTCGLCRKKCKRKGKLTVPVHVENFDFLLLRRLCEIIPQSEDLEKENTVLISINEIIDIHPGQIKQLNEADTMKFMLQKMALPRSTSVAKNLVQLCVRLSDDNKIRSRYRAELILVLMELVKNGKEDLEYTRDVSTLLRNLCIRNSEASERLNLLPILHEYLRNPDYHISLHALQGLFCLCFIMEDNSHHVLDVADSGICKLLPEIFEKDDNEVKCLCCYVFAAISECGSACEEMIYETDILLKFIPLFSSNDKCLRAEVSNAVCEISRLKNLKMESFINAGLIPVLWKATVDTIRIVRINSISTIASLFSNFNTELNTILIKEGSKMLASVSGKNSMLSDFLLVLERIQYRLDMIKKDSVDVAQ